MAEIKTLTCTVCPIGCTVKVSMEQGKILDITGNSCNRGKVYAEAEVTNPVRTLTTTVRVKDGDLPVLPVRSERPIPKHLQKECVLIINKLDIKVPVKIGDVIFNDILGTGINIIASRNI